MVIWVIKFSTEGYKLQNEIDFLPKINIFKENYCILYIDIAKSCQKLGAIFENRVQQNLKFKENVCNKKRSPKLIVLNEKKNQKKSVDF
jgi:hypothetical protein